MATLVLPGAPPPRPSKIESNIPVLENGDKLTAPEFLRRYEAMFETKKAELINSTVFMASPVRFTHSQPDGLFQTWIGVYAANTPGLLSLPNVTVRLTPKNVVQPDAALIIDPQFGGRTRTDAKGYLTGGPELVIEVAASSVSIDATDKLELYFAALVPEYILFRTEDLEIDWHNLGTQSYMALKPDALGIIKSKVFPGLWLNIAALLKGDASGILSALQQGLESPEHAAFVKELQQRAPKS